MKYWRKRDNWILKLLIKTCTLYAHYKIRRHDHEHLVSTGHLAGISLQAWQLTRDICVQQGVGGRILLRFQSLSRPVNRNYSESRLGHVNPTLWLNRGSRHEVDSFFFFLSPVGVDRATTCGWPRMQMREMRLMRQIIEYMKSILWNIREESVEKSLSRRCRGNAEAKSRVSRWLNW